MLRGVEKAGPTSFTTAAPKLPMKETTINGQSNMDKNNADRRKSFYCARCCNNCKKEVGGAEAHETCRVQKHGVVVGGGAVGSSGISICQ
jgi:hypothetical protein